MVYLLRILFSLVLDTATGQVSITDTENYLHSLSLFGLRLFPQCLTSTGIGQNAFQSFISQVAAPNTFLLYLTLTVDPKVPHI